MTIKCYIGIIFVLWYGSASVALNKVDTFMVQGRMTVEWRF